MRKNKDHKNSEYEQISRNVCYKGLKDALIAWFGKIWNSVLFTIFIYAQLISEKTQYRKTFTQNLRIIFV